MNAPCAVNFNDIGYNFVKRPIEMEPLFHSLALQQYILLCSQVWFSNIDPFCDNWMLDWIGFRMDCS